MRPVVSRTTPAAASNAARPSAPSSHSWIRRTPPRASDTGTLRAADGEIDLGAAHLRREGNAAILELRNPRHLNAEDDTTLPATETAVDLALLEPGVEVAVFRGGVVDHARYAGRRSFGAGINLTHLYQGRVGYLFYVDRDLGYVSKLFPRAERARAPAGRARAHDREAVGGGRRAYAIGAPASCCT